MAQTEAENSTPRPMLRAPILFLPPSEAATHVRRVLAGIPRELGPMAASAILKLEALAVREMEEILTDAQAEPRRVREAIEAHLDAAEAMIASLDSAEPDPDLEDNGDAELEPDVETDLGWPEMANQTKAIKACMNPGASQDFEQDNADDEPSLGWTVSGYFFGTDDREQDCEDEGACETALEVL